MHKYLSRFLSINGEYPRRLIDVRSFEGITPLLPPVASRIQWTIWEETIMSQLEFQLNLKIFSRGPRNPACRVKLSAVFRLVVSVQLNHRI